MSDIKKIGPLCLLLFAMPAMAESEYMPAELMFLYESGDYAAALSYARRFKSTQTDMDFYYYYGLAAVQTGQLSEAIAALEKVMRSEPDNYVVQLALAKAYDQQDLDEQSRVLLQAMSAQDLPADILAEVHGLAKDTDQSQRQLAGALFFAQTGLGVDDNPGEVQLLGRTRGPARFFIQRRQSARQQDSFWTGHAGAGWYQPVLEQSALRLMLELETRLYRSNNELNFNDYTLQASFEKNSEHYDFEAGLMLQQLQLDSSEFQSSQTWELGWYPRLNDSLSLILEGQFIDREFDQQAFFNSELFYYNLGLQINFEMAGQPSLGLSYLSGNEDPDQAASLTQVFVKRDISALELQLDIRLSQSLDLQLLLTEQNSDFETLSGAILRFDREENYSAAGLELTYRINKHLKTAFYWRSVENDDQNRLSAQSFSFDLSRSFSQSLLGVELRYDWSADE